MIDLRSPSFHSGHRASWGDFEVERVWKTYDFWALMDELQNDQSGFWNNRAVLLDAFVDKRLYTLKVFDYPREMRNDPIFARDHTGMVSEFLLPCLCVVGKMDEDVCEIVCVHTRARRLGIASAMLNQLFITSADGELDQAKPFWDSFLGRTDVGEAEDEDINLI
jgi:hypothetical protein